MIIQFFKKNGLKQASTLVEPDEIFLDSTNLQNFNRQQFEGRIEKPISKLSIFSIGLSAVLLALVFSLRLGYLQIAQGEAYLGRSERNTLEKQYLFADRGIIYDRHKVELAWNQREEDQEVSKRRYRSSGSAHALGYVSYPAKDKKNIYWKTEFEGKDGLEKQYNAHLRGKNGEKIVEIDAHGEVHSENVVNLPERGRDLITTLDSRIQTELYELIAKLADENSFRGGSGIILDIQNGEIIAATSFPEYDSEILSLGWNREKITEYMSDPRKVFLDRVISGLYTPGSILKPFWAIGALTEGVIDPFKEILSTGSISVPNPYFPDQKTVFKDWKAHGWTDMSEAIAVSSDVYFYAIGGGFEGQSGIGVKNIEKYARLFGIGEKTGVDLPDETGGVIPNPEWKAQVFSGDPWRLGDTYNTVIGQYGFQVTPIQMVRATAALGNFGTLLTPHFTLEEQLIWETQKTKIDLPLEHFKAAQEGMREAVIYGTASVLNVPYVEVAAKTGTAQLGAAKDRINSWVVGFFPYQKPRYAFTIMMESGPSAGGVGATVIMRGLLDWMFWETPEYFETSE